jgi:hypothetical protein
MARTDGGERKSRRGGALKIGGVQEVATSCEWEPAAVVCFAHLRSDQVGGGAISFL